MTILNCLRPFSLSPVVLLRAAAFPLEAVGVFGDRTLATFAASLEIHHVERIATSYASVMARERDVLWHATVGGKRFMKALALANPRLAARARAATAVSPRTKQRRQLETALYRYLARSVGRTDPCDLWAGVALARWGKETRVVGVPEGYAITPDLRPFRHLVRRLATRPEYRSRGRYRLNPTLAKQPDDSWIFWAWTEAGELVKRRMDGDPRLDRALRQIATLAPLPPAEIAAAVGGAQDSRLLSSFDAMIAGGLLVGGLDLPSSFETAWQALDDAARQLDKCDRLIWTSRVGRLRALCSELEHRFEVLDVSEIAETAAAAAREITNLAHDLDIELPTQVARTALRCDLRLPFQIELGPEVRRVVEDSIAAYDTFLRSWSPVSLYRQARRQQFADLMPNGLALVNAGTHGGAPPTPVTWEALAAMVPGAPSLQQRIADWDALLSTDGADSVEICLGPQSNGGASANLQPPLACLLATPRQDICGPHLQISGALDDVSPVYARFAALLNPAGPPCDDPLLRWVRASFARLEDRWRVEIAEMKAPGYSHPNLIAGPDFTSNGVELWGATPGRLSLKGAHVIVDTGVPLLRLPGRPKPLLVFACTAADISRNDPFSQLLLLTSFRESPGAQFRAANLLFESEIARPRWAPRVRLPNGAVVRPRRTALCGDALTQLIGGRSPMVRYIAWQKLAARHRWPPLLALRRDGGSPLLIQRDSPLALEAALAGVGPNTRLLVVEEFEARPWLVGPNGERFISELAVPYERHNHLLASRGGGA
jgi:hypothetical protein